MKRGLDVQKQYTVMLPVIMKMAKKRNDCVRDS